MPFPKRSLLGADLYVESPASIRIRSLVDRVEAAITGSALGGGWLLPATNAVLREVGIDFSGANVLSLDDIFERRGAVIREGSALSLFLAAIWHVIDADVRRLGPMAARLQPEAFEAELNAILDDEGAALRLRDGAWAATVATDAEVLRRVLLEDVDDAVACKQGDVQVEMVASTVQTKLAAPSAVVVDYGAGMGRVLAGLATAHNFKTAHYIAVDEPMRSDVRSLAGRAGAKSEFIDRRDEYLRNGTPADVIMVVNTLHHIPFVDISRQIGALLGKLRPGGTLVVHEMGLLRAPEKANVAWRCEDLIKLFEGTEFKCNARSTMSRSGIMLAHVLVEPGSGSTDDALKRNVPLVWRQMKERALVEIRGLYSARDPERECELQHALITNANLDLNQPPPA
jgi:hypothetical protein